MYSTQWIIVILCWLRSEDDASLTDLPNVHIHQYSDGRRWDHSFLYRLEVVQAAHRPASACSWYWVLPGNRACTNCLLKVTHALFPFVIYENRPISLFYC